MPDQEARFSRAKEENNERYLNIGSVFDGSYLKGKRVAITGATRGLGLAIAQEAKKNGAELVLLNRSESDDAKELEAAECIFGVDVTDDNVAEKLKTDIKGGPIDILINNAGYFYGPVEKIDSLNFEEEKKMIDICAIGPLRITAAMYNDGLLKKGSKVICITSQGGSVTWRTTQNPTGHDYGHHMSKSAANMAARLLAQEFKDKEIAVGILHPGFNKSEMTEKYSDIWEKEGAVDPSEGAMRVLYETGKLDMSSSGKFINCEDGLEIPF